MTPSLKSVKSDILPETLQKGAEALRDDEEFLDFTIIANETRFRTHKVILASSSDFFRAMLRHSESVESQTNECQIQDVTPAVMEKILDFCYTSRIELEIENVQDILMAASFLQIVTLQDLCVEYIIEMIDINNCLDFLTLADRCNLPILIESALSFCSDNFDTLSAKEELLSLDASLLSKIISSDCLSVENEEKVLTTVRKWIEAGEDRFNELENLAIHIRFPLMGPHSLIILSRESQIRESTKCRDLIGEAKDYQTLEAFPEEKLRSKMVGKRFEPRYSSALRREQRIFAVGGWNDRAVDTSERYDPYKDSWIRIGGMTKPRYGLGLSILGNHLYAIGGQNEDDFLSNVECYNIEENFWRSDVASMKHSRTNVGVCEWNGRIYAIGGHLEDQSLDFVEQYKPETNEWCECASLRQERSEAAVVVCNNSIYAVGGFELTTGVLSTLETVERFNSSKDEWAFVAPMMTSRTSFGCTTFEGKIYAVGGKDSSGKPLDTGECYDPAEDCWEAIPPMSVKRSDIGLVEIDGLLYAMGGVGSDNTVLKLVEAYDTVKKEWTTKCHMINARANAGFALYSPMKQQTSKKMICEPIMLD